jgi:hypothetical protein
VIAVTGVDPTIDMTVIGEWVTRGAAIFTLNGKPIQSDASFAAQVLDNLQVDPDGYTRVAARYRPLGKTRASNGLLALPAIRSVGLENGYVFTIRGTGEAEWQTVVSDVPAENSGSLQKGDVLLSEAQTGMTFDGSESLDALLAQLVSANQAEARFSVSRNGTEAAAAMRLVQE